MPDPLDLDVLKARAAAAAAIRQIATNLHPPFLPEWFFDALDYDALITELEEARAEIERHHRDFERWEEMANKGAAQLKELTALRRKDELAQAVVEAAEGVLENQADDIDLRLKYVMVQPDRNEWLELGRTVDAYREEIGRECRS